MDLKSRMKLGGNESNFVDSFMPITPVKAIAATSDLTQILMNGNGTQMGRESWEQLSGISYPNYDTAGISSGNLNEKNRMINQIAGSFSQALQNESVDWDGSFLSLLEMENDTNLNEGLMEPSSAEFLLDNETHFSNSNILAGIPQYGFPVLYNPQYDLNTIPSMETCSASTLTNLSQFEPVTPNEKLRNDRGKQQYVPSENHVDPASEIISLLSEEPKNAVLTTPIKEPKDSGMLIEEIIDLNSTPQLKTPKRRKHRPKVIVEGKSKRTPKAADPEKKASEKRKYVRKVQQEKATSHPNSAGEIASSKEKPKEKRKYVRKDLKEPAAGNADNNGVMKHATTRNVEPSCKKALNFDSENVSQPQLLNKKVETSELRTGVRFTEPVKPNDLIGRRDSSLQTSQHDKAMFETTEEISNLSPAMNLMADNNALNSGRKGAGSGYLSVSNRMENDLSAITRDANFINRQFLSSDRTGQMLFHYKPQSQFSSYIDESRRSKRGYCQIMQRHGANNHHGQEIYHTNGYHLNSSIANDACSETRKKKKIDNGDRTNIDGSFPFVTAVDHSRSSTSRYNVNSVASASQRNSEILNLNLKRNDGGREFNESIRFPVHYSSTNSVVSGQDKSKQSMTGSHSRKEITEENFQSIILQTLASANTFVGCNMLPPTPRVSSQHKDTWKHTNSNLNLSRRQEIVPLRSQYVPSKEYKMRQPEVQAFNNGQSPGKRKGPATKHKFPVTVEEIIYQMESLNLHETHALVPFKGDGTLIPYEGIIRKRKPRPKVDLDAETERVWKLLMWKEGSEDQGTDEEKRKWWDEERRVFRGRADSFIARMHLVQGDRRFSKWKGSVVDSVIGVFLTQNVSDHLSSSAFMSLAARFPPKPTTDRTCQRDGTIVLVEEPDLDLSNLNEKLQERLLRHPFYAHSSMTPYGLEEQQLESETSCTEITGRVKGYSHSPEEVLSSQDSFDSSVSQSNGVRSYSGSNSEAEEHANGFIYNKNHGDLRAESKASFAEFYSNISGISLFPEESRIEHRQPEATEYRQQKIRSERTEYSHKVSSTFNPQINYSNLLMQIPSVPSSNYQFTTSHSGILEGESLNSLREESISSWPSGASILNKEKDAGCTSVAENVGRTTQYGSENEMTKSFNLKYQSSNEPVNLADEQANGQFVSNMPTGKLSDGKVQIDLTGNQQPPSENKFVESGSKDNVTNKVNVNVKTDKERKDKGKANGEKKGTFDWDSLRKQVLENSESKGKSKDSMDSLDYAAMRTASVNQISDTIRERGMNNMLAERIKEFLDRLVRDHGSVDLEWLRDVPPDKAKEYLLSIRGLGLKSVECVRLLTLHHLAFPVDTNVGRIAVRLGWVPLQPLPESLQLHLLELYPILESIQKYLWPRLCKLDQRTLYELHYQMITFGKVFCTKSRPNCNACPMRAECRHFASAFASARLALPGPEEKSIVTHNVPLATESGPGIIINPMPLPSPEVNKRQRIETEIVSCVPIIEEPATPEQEHVELLESDIEDIFDDNSDEIPTIKLNMEELSVNLQKHMQDNMDLQEFDMSKALVALNPNAASIPTPKLKYVSRLRTEHSVYELPDSHPLLSGMDKRETDDPSPYLLAIWTPGETAESIQPPGKHCQSQVPDMLCNEKTCFSCNSIREANSQIVRGTLLIPCRTAMRGSFPLNGTYFQVNEMFADHASSVDPIDVPRAWIWNLPRRMVYFGTSVSTIFKGLSTEEIQYCFWRGFVCVRGFDQKSRAPRPLLARLHFPASKLAKNKHLP